MADTSAISLETAYLRGFDSWEQTLTEWGNVRSTAPADRFIISDLQRRGIAAIGISPTSDIDEVYIRRDLGPSSTVDPIYIGNLQSRQIAVRTDLPLVGGLTANWRAMAPKETMWGDTYTQIDGSPAAFGLAEPLFIAPTLRLLAYLTPTSVGIPPRLPGRTVTAHSFAGGGQELVQIVPVFGRRTVRISARVAAATTVDFAVNGVSGQLDLTLFPPTSRLQEFPLGTLNVVGGVAGNTGSVVVTNVHANFLVLKATRTAGAGAVPRILIDARD